MKRQRSIIAFSLFVLLSGYGCSGKKSGDGDTTASNSSGDEPKDTDDEDETSVADAVPMALLGPDYIASVGGHLTPAIADGRYGDAPRDDASSVEDDPADKDYNVAVDLIQTPARAAGEMKNLLASVQGILGDYFGTSGFFKGRDVNIPRDSNERIFRIDEKSVVVIRRGEEGSQFQYGADAYKKAADGSYLRTTKIDFSEAEDGNVEVAFDHRVADESVGMTERILASYETKDLAIHVLFGYEGAPTTVPARTKLSLIADETAKTTTLQGGYIWRTELQPDNDSIAPRHYTRSVGDVEVFQAKSSDTSTGDTVQKLAFLPAEDSLVKTADNAIFTKHSYPVYMRAFLRKLVRDPEINQSCATSGHLFADAFAAASKTAPTSVSGAPDDICDTNASFSNAGADALLKATYDAGIDIQLTVAKAPGSTETTVISLSAWLNETVYLTNPQYLFVDGQSRVLLLPPDKPHAEHKELSKGLDKTDLIGLSELTETKWPKPLTRPASDFKDAEPAPAD